MIRLSLIAPLACLLIATVFAPLPAVSQQDIGAQIPGLTSLPDRSAEFQQRIDEGGGALLLEPGIHRITRPLVMALAKHPDGGIRAPKGKATLVMDGPGPAIRLEGTHQGSADPKSFDPASWPGAMPIVEGITILGHHPEADGIELFQCVQPIVTRVAIRGCRHGIRLVTRNRNVTISDCQIYENSGIGIYYDDVNLHQSNISNCHVSYNRQGGIVVRDGNVRNVHITGCDIEANMPDDTETPSDKIANVLLDVSGSAGDKTRSIAEVAITGCTIQHSANYGADAGKTVAPGAANIRLLGKEIWPIDSVAITGNVLSDTTVNVHIDQSTDITLSGNTFFAPKPDQLVVTGSRRVVVTGNTFNPREFERPGALRFADSFDCVISGSTIHDAHSPEGAVILENCEGFVIDGLNLTDCSRGIVLKNTRDTLISNCRVARTAGGAPDLEIDGTSRDIQIEGNRLTGILQAPPGTIAK